MTFRILEFSFGLAAELLAIMTAGQGLSAILRAAVRLDICVAAEFEGVPTGKGPENANLTLDP